MTVLSESQRFALVPFGARYAGTIQGWVVNRDEAAAWAGLDDVPRDPSIFTRWHSDPEVHGWVLLCDGVPIGYGEVWENFDTGAVELARLIVAPPYRGQGIGRVLIDRLCALVVAGFPTGPHDPDRRSPDSHEAPLAIAIGCRSGDLRSGAAAGSGDPRGTSAQPPAAVSKTAFVRVRPGNAQAIRCYERAGFRRVSPEREREYNTGQPVEYVWMRRAPSLEWRSAGVDEWGLVGARSGDLRSGAPEGSGDPR